MDKNFVSAIIVAAGNSTRMGTGRPKIFEDILGIPSVVYTLNEFNICDLVNEIIIVCKEEHRDTIKNLIKENKISKFKCFANGGDTRQESVFEGVKCVSEDSTHLLVHDAARILITKDIIENAVHDSFKEKFSAVGVPIKDTVKLIDDKNFIIKTIDRSRLFSIQTPQVFERKFYLKAMEKAIFENKNYTDDCQLIENFGGKVHFVMGSYSNLKLTTMDDVPIFESILKRRNSKWG